MKSKKVFIAKDTFVAFIDRAHPKHIHANAFFRYFAQEKYMLFTNEVNMHDAYTVLYERISPSLAKEFVKTLAISNINILYSEESDIKNVFKAISQYASPELKFSEALMAVLCNKRAIPYICTFEYLHSLFGLQTFYLPI